MTGEFVRSKAGHDKGKLYIVIKEDEDFVYLSDGGIKPIDKPKKKRKKHIRPIHRVVPEAFSTNEEIKRSIKKYEREIVNKISRNDSEV